MANFIVPKLFGPHFCRMLGRLYQLPALTPEFPAIVAGFRITLARGLTSFFFFQSGCAQAEIGPGERAGGLASSKSLFFLAQTHGGSCKKSHWDNQTHFPTCSLNDSVMAVRSLSEAVSYPPARMFWKLLAESASGDDLGEQSAD